MAPTTLFIILLLVHISNSNTCDATNPAPKFPAVLVFGDSTVDTGNNNYLKTLFKGNHYPYGKDFPGQIPTGRFSNGKLVPDFLVSILNIKQTVPPFLDPSLSDNDLITGVCFASGGSGYDDITAAGAGILAFSKQIELFKEYVVRVERILGDKEAKKLITSSLIVVSAGTNDFGFNFYDIPTRRLEFNISGYQDFLLNKLHIFIEELYELGCRKLAIAGLPPVGCLPIQVTVKFGKPKDGRCVDDENSDSQIYNQKLVKLLSKMQSLLPGSRIVYLDVYEPLIDMINNPHKFGFVVTKRGCCGTGFVEAGPLCNALTPVCADDSEYLFWDSIHPTEATYQYLSKYLEKNVLPKFAYRNQSRPSITRSGHPHRADDRY
ncbi:hypothetical protein TB2_038290 [Malus domestica]